MLCVFDCKDGLKKLPQNRVEMLIGSLAEFEIKTKIRISFLLDNTVL